MLIRTKFIGPTNTKGSRVKAVSISGKSAITSWENCADIESNHEAARGKLAARLIADGAMEPILWVLRTDRDGSMIHIGLHKHEIGSKQCV